MFKDLVVPLTNTAGDASAVDGALAIASRHGAHVCLLEFVNLPLLPVDPWGGLDIGIEQLYEEFRTDAEADASKWRDRLAREDITSSAEVRLVESTVAESPNRAALHARYTDMAVLAMATDPVRDGAVVRDFFSSLLHGSGRPVLMVPSGFAWKPIRHVVVAWQPRRESTRALHDAMPFLREAESIDLLEVGEARGEASDGPLAGADIAAHLARHGLKVDVVTRPLHADSVAMTLAKHARETAADLMVCGGYGHSRFREWALGGVTRDLVAGASALPILFSH